MPYTDTDDLWTLQPPLPTPGQALLLRELGWSNVPIHYRYGWTHARWWMPPWLDVKKEVVAYTTTEALQLSRARGLLPTLVDR